jgi:hypothetical protein
MGVTIADPPKLSQCFEKIKDIVIATDDTFLISVFFVEGDNGTTRLRFGPDFYERIVKPFTVVRKAKRKCEIALKGKLAKYQLISDVNNISSFGGGLPFPVLTPKELLSTLVYFMRDQPTYKSGSERLSQCSTNYFFVEIEVPGKDKKSKEIWIVSVARDGKNWALSASDTKGKLYIKKYDFVFL